MGKPVSDHEGDRRPAEDVIAEVDAADLSRARALIAHGIQEAQTGWVPANLIADALVLELLTLLQGHTDAASAAAYLRALARTIDQAKVGSGVH